MNIRPLALSLVTLLLGIGQPLTATDAPTVAAKPGYRVVLDVTVNEQGLPEDAKLVENEDFSGEQTLYQIALLRAEELKLAPRLKDGKPVKYTARVPFDFPVQDDEGAAANNAPKPSLRTAPKPDFPEDLAAKGENGGAILELVIGSFGNVESVKVLRSSHQGYADAAVTAVKTWVFKPAEKEGVAVESRWRIAVGFSADGKDVEWKWKIAPRPSLGNFMVVRPKLPVPGAPAAAPAATPAPTAEPAK